MIRFESLTSLIRGAGKFIPWIGPRTNREISPAEAVSDLRRIVSGVHSSSTEPVAPTRPIDLTHITAHDGTLRIITADADRRYRIVAELGRGGMGIVFRAHDTTLDRPVALKMVTAPSMNPEEFLKQFRREQSIQGQLGDPLRAVPIYDYGRTVDGQPFSVLELIEAGTLAPHLSPVVGQGPAVLSLMKEMAACVAVAHRRGFVHRDVKPANFFVRQKTPRWILALGDFGIAEQEERLQSNGGEVQGSIAGTPGFMPFNLFYHGSAPKRAADCWALGSIGYFLLTGQTPYTAQKVDGLVPLMLEAPLPKRPSEIHPEIAEDANLLEAERIVMRALSDDRTSPQGVQSGYATAMEMLFDLSMASAKKQEEKARTLLTSLGDSSQLERRFRRNQAIDLMRAAVAEAEATYREYPDPLIEGWIREARSHLHKLAQDAGAVPLMEAQANVLGITRPLPVDLFIDGDYPPDAEPELTVYEGIDDAGVLRTGRVHQREVGPLVQSALELRELAPGRPHVVQLVDKRGRFKSVRIPIPPLPPREGRMILRAPIYQSEDSPGGTVLIPAGPTFYTVGHAPFAERPDRQDGREVNEDLLVWPLVNEESWYLFVEEFFRREGAKATIGLFPSHWPVLARMKFESGKMPSREECRVRPDTPVTGVTAEAGLDYVRYHQKFLNPRMPPGTNYLTSEQFKRWFKGNDQRIYPHGSAFPTGYAYGAKIDGVPAPTGVFPNAFEIDGRPILDLSPWAVRHEDGRNEGSPWAVSNVKVYLKGPETPEAQERLARFLRLSPADLRTRVLVTGTSWKEAFPTSLNLIDHVPANFTGYTSGDRDGTIGLRFATPLQQTFVLPTLDSLTGQSA